MPHSGQGVTEVEITSPIKDDDNEMNVNCKSLDHSWPAHAEPVPNGGLDGYLRFKKAGYFFRVFPGY